MEIRKEIPQIISETVRYKQCSEARQSLTTYDSLDSYSMVGLCTIAMLRPVLFSGEPYSTSDFSTSS